MSHWPRESFRSEILIFFPLRGRFPQNSILTSILGSLRVRGYSSGDTFRTIRSMIAGVGHARVNQFYRNPATRRRFIGVVKCLLKPRLLKFFRQCITVLRRRCIMRRIFCRYKNTASICDGHLIHGRRHGVGRVGPPWKKSGWAWPTLEILAVVWKPPGNSLSMKV